MDDEIANPRARLARMSDGDFLAAWKRVFGQPPAALLERATMIDLLLEDGPARLMLRERDRLRVRAAMADARCDRPEEAWPRRSYRGR